MNSWYYLTLGTDQAPIFSTDPKMDGFVGPFNGFEEARAHCDNALRHDINVLRRSLSALRRGDFLIGPKP